MAILEKHKILEKNATLLLVGSLLVVTIGGIVEITPLFYLQNTIEKVEGMRPYTPLELTGRDIYIREGCYVCHSQMIRPMRDEVERYGHYSLAAESMYDHPFQWGSKRTGPDLARVGGRYSDEWHVAHLTNPQSVVPESVMPKYGFLLNREINTQDLQAKLETHAMVGVPYTSEMIEAAKADFAAQADPDADSSGLEERYAKANKLPEPKEWQDLAKPVFYDHVAIAAPSRSGTTAWSNSGANASSVVCASARRRATSDCASSFQSCWCRCESSVELKTFWPVSDCVAKNSTFMSRNSWNGAMNGLRKPCVHASVSSPGWRSSFPMERNVRASRLVASFQAMSSTRRNVSSRFGTGASPHRGQKRDASTVMQPGQVQLSVLASAIDRQSSISTWSVCTRRRSPLYTRTPSTISIVRRPPPSIFTSRRSPRASSAPAAPLALRPTRPATATPVAVFVFPALPVAVPPMIVPGAAPSAALSRA